MEFYEFYTKDGKEADVGTCNYAIIYKYLGDFEDYCEQEGIVTDGLRDIYIENAFSPVVLFIDTYEEIRWHKVEKNDYPKWLIGKLAERKMTAVAPKFEKNDNPVWDLIIHLTDGETVIQTNEVPISINEIYECLEVLQKPSIFGNRIEKFEIVRRG